MTYTEWTGRVMAALAAANGEPVSVSKLLRLSGTVWLVLRRYLHSMPDVHSVRVGGKVGRPRIVAYRLAVTSKPRSA
jgi:hypothetical protein